MVTATLVALQLAQGNEVTSLISSAGTPPRQVQTFSMTLSNKSVVDFIIQKEPNTPAS